MTLHYYEIYRAPIQLLHLQSDRSDLETVERVLIRRKLTPNFRVPLIIPHILKCTQKLLNDIQGASADCNSTGRMIWRTLIKA